MSKKFVETIIKNLKKVGYVEDSVDMGSEALEHLKLVVNEDTGRIRSDGEAEIKRIDAQEEVDIANLTDASHAEKAKLLAEIDRLKSEITVIDARLSNDLTAIRDEYEDKRKSAREEQSRRLLMNDEIIRALSEVKKSETGTKKKS